MQIVERIQRLGLTREEYYVLKALILANSDARSDEPQALYRFRDSILNSLSDCVAAVRPGQALRATQNMLLVLPSLRQADGVIRRFWSNVYRIGKVPMNKLFEEMLENVCYRWDTLDHLKFDNSIAHYQDHTVFYCKLMMFTIIVIVYYCTSLFRARFSMCRYVIEDTSEC